MRKPRINFAHFRSRPFPIELRQSLLFLPGAFLVGLGLLAIFAPTLLFTLIAAFFMFAGFLACLLVWKFLKFKKQVQNMLKQMEGQVTVHTVNVQDPFSTEEESQETKKIIYH